MSDKGQVLDVASALAEGSVVNWEDAERLSADDRDRSVVRALRVLADIAEVARRPSSERTDDDIVSPAPPPIWGHLRVIDQLGHGAFGTVFRAWDSTLEREVALKLMRAPEVLGVVEPSRALKEARRLARVRHPNVVTIHGADCRDGRFGLWMELIKGCTLNELMLTQGTMSAREAAGIGVDLCHALAAVHGAHLLHGDVKASNVMREDGGRVVLMDFGAGRQIPRDGEQPHGLAGTLMYLAPELLAGENSSVASDLYSLGVLLYQLVSGKYPVAGSNRVEVAMAHARHERVSLRDARPDLPPAFSNVVDKALAPAPKDRYKSAGQFGAALAEVVGTQYRRDPFPVPHWKTVAAVAAGVALLAGGIQVGRVIVGDKTRSTSGLAAIPDGRVATLASTPVAPVAYRVSAAFYALRGGFPVRLSAGSAVAPGDHLFLSIDASRPVFAYVVNQDERGESYLLFPLPGVEPGNPVPVGRTTRLPGSRNSEEHYWEVTSAGGREHFFVYISPERLTEFEQLLAALPRAEIGRPVESVPLSASAVGELRGVGGLTTAGAQTGNTFALSELPILPDEGEAASGVWARRIVFDNPVK